ncbi:sodium-dependent transporter bedraggled isoform X1 [Temnothorax americanus]|uniref:sodium-dependent transporter bedraggled isoform X1 n=2 Tax=Temnothorax americanus TaxID=1964332 RepID=UPI0040682BC0
MAGILLHNLLRYVRNGVNRRKMASNEDGDLIDLGNDACVPRVTVDDATPDEQEHLLDVCPPKLEQKLSLTRQQERVLNSIDKGDILVTLGHDQVVPIRKRIDVVSSDTIKRVRDITRHLEPVIRKTCSDVNEEAQQDTVDHATISSCERTRGASTARREDETYETREINDAFDFLAEHDDNEDQAETRCGRARNENVDPNRTTSSVRLSIGGKEDRVSYPFESSSRTSNEEANGRSDAEETKGAVTPSEYDVQPDDDPVYKSLPSSNKFREDGSPKDRSVSIESEPRARVVLKRRGREDDAFERGSKRRSFQESHRKSWTEGTSLNSSHFTDGLSGIDRSTSLKEYRCVPSISNVDRGAASFLTRQPPEAESATSPSEDVCSEGSEVDWSWLEEVEYPRAAESLAAAGERGAGEQGGRASAAAPTRGSAGRRRGCEHRETATGRSVAMSVTATAKSLAGGGGTRWSPSGGALLHDRQNNGNNNRRSGGRHRRHRNVNDNNNDGDDDDDDDDDEAAAAARCNATNEAVDRENRDGTATTAVAAVTSSVAAAANSWMRASMRRLRHLRLPEGTQRAGTGNNEPADRRAVVVSAPNSLPDIALIAPEILAAQTNGSGTSGTLLRPSSAPARNAGAGAAGAATPRRAAGRQFAGGRSRRGARNREVSSRQGSLIGSTTTASDTTASGNTTCSSSFGGASSSAPSSTPTSPRRTAPRRVCERQRDADRHNDRGEDDDEDENPLGKWPHALSSTLACLGCTLGLFNISRFAILSVQFGANFIVQFLILSLVLGIPLLTLQVCLGQRLAAGSVDMWRISPLFQGVGIALLTAQAFIGIYSIVGVSWMFVYFRDSFITKQDRYRWAEPFLLYRDDSRPTYNTTASYKLYETVPDYFSGAVLQRHHLNEANPGVVTLKFQVAFNLAVVWMIVFVSLSKGLRSYGKVVYVFTLVPVFGTLILCTKLLGLTPPGSIHQLFPATVWSEFFINGKSWVAASNEVFLTWGLLGAAAMQITAHNKHKHLLQRDTSLVVILTFVVLLLGAFLANTCVQILRHHGYVYTTSSFERISGYTFMRLVSQPAPSGYSSTPERFMSHASFLLGQRVIRPGADTSTESGYQVLRLATELVPSTLALLGAEQVSPFWAVLFYFIFILFGIAQQLAIWHCVITGIMAINTKMMKLWETTITFFSCACAYILGLPMATELGIYVVYYLDYTVGGAWWIIVLYLMQIAAVFAVRGRPHTGEAVVAELFPPTGRCLRYWAGPLLSFTWNVILPVTLMVLSITIFKSSDFRELYSYRRTGKDYWAVWARQLGAAIQLTPILMIPAVAVIQTCRYLNSGPPDIFDNGQVEVTINHCEQCNGRIQLLYRPPLEPEDPRDAQTQIGNDTGTSLHGNGILPAATTEIPFEDPPPKYTPPPSYTTATGARIAKMLRQSFRRSVRRIANVLGESSAPRQRPALQPPPPDYATVLVEMNQSGTPMSRDHVAIHVLSEPRPDVTNTGGSRHNVDTSVIERRHRPNTIDRASRINIAGRSRTIERTHSTIDRGRRSYANTTAPHTLSGPNLTAADVANLLRSSIRRGTVRTQQSLRRSFCHEERPTTAASVENLVEAAAPIGEDSLILSKDTSLVPDEQVDDRSRRDGGDHDDGNEGDEKKTASEMESSVSVI